VVGPLCEAATEPERVRRPHLGLDALDDQGPVQRAGHRDHRRDDGLVLLVPAQASDEAPVDLENVEREPAQVGQRRVAGAEVVERQPDAQVGRRLPTARGHATPYWKRWGITIADPDGYHLVLSHRT
jgi:hypothetical protein